MWRWELTSGDRRVFEAVGGRFGIPIGELIELADWARHSGAKLAELRQKVGDGWARMLVSILARYPVLVP